MTTPEARPEPPALPAQRAGDGPLDVPRATRNPQGAWLGGVCNGVSDHLGWPVAVVRGGFFALAMAQFVGVFAYALLWIMMPRRQGQDEAPGLEAAARQGLRTRPDGNGPDETAVPIWRRDSGAVSALALFAGGAIFLSQGSLMGLGNSWLLPLLFAGCGVALIWRQADEQPQDAREEESASRWLRPFLARHGWPAVTRLVLGVGLVGLAVSMVAAGQLGVAELPRVLGLSALMVAGVVIAAAPWIHRLRTGLRQAHEQKLLDDARADMAAHLHDSVLQTLALIQRQSEDPKAVAALARRQERELRTWLYGDQPAETTLKAALTRAAAEVEDDTAVAFELVCVGDADLTPALEALVRAAREAMMNAAKHAGVDQVDVFGEIEDGAVEVFVRDRGRGFDPELIADDRMGVRRSILERMERHGGTASIRTAPGEGTEVTLRMDIEGRA